MVGDQYAALPAAGTLRTVLVARPTAPLYQRDLFRPCGRAPAIAGLCQRCYRAQAHSRLYFAGFREAVLERDGRRCRSCGAGKSGRSLQVHHRLPGLHHPDFLVTLCAGCHARTHRLLAVRRFLPEFLLVLWVEQHPTLPQQLQFAFQEAA
jgi:hypothetical protein